MSINFLISQLINEPVHEISNNVVCETSKPQISLRIRAVKLFHILQLAEPVSHKAYLSEELVDHLNEQIRVRLFRILMKINGFNRNPLFPVSCKSCEALYMCAL